MGHTKKETSDKLSKKQKTFLETLSSAMGIVSVACKKAKIGRTTYYRWLNENSVFKELVDEVNEETIDGVESKLLSAISQNNITGIIFYLKTKAKHRGYVEKFEQEVSVNPFIELMKASAEDDEEEE